jgi:calcium permeable stress-gated cation channel
MHIGKVTNEKIYEKTNQRPLMHPFHFGSFVEICCCCLSQSFKENNRQVTDAIAFYQSNEEKLKIKIAECKQKAFKKPLGIVFITFEDQKMAANFLKYYHLGLFGRLLKKACLTNRSTEEQDTCSTCYLCHKLPRASSISHELKTDDWHAKYAPSPSNIKWENIARISSTWWMRYILINVSLIIMMIFFTTPSILIEKLTSVGSVVNIATIEVQVKRFSNAL